MKLFICKCSKFYLVSTTLNKIDCPEVNFEVCQRNVEKCPKLGLVQDSFTQQFFMKVQKTISFTF